MSDQIFWYATRAAGLLCWFAACASVIVGLLTSSRALGRRPTLPWLTDLHRYFGAMAVVALATHLGSLWADAFVTLGWRELIVPGLAVVPGLSRLALALGVISAWLMALVEASSLLKRWLPSRLWHGVHLTSYAVVVLSTVHAWQTGSDVTNRVLIAVGSSVVAAMVLLTAVRLLRWLSDRKYRYDVLTGTHSRQPQRS